MVWTLWVYTTWVTNWLDPVAAADHAQRAVVGVRPEDDA
jgi:low temperature requirement protein LtrA